MHTPVEFGDIERQHEELKKVITHLQDTVAQESSPVSGERRRAALQEEVAQLRTSLVEHFRLEEEGGYLEAVTAAGHGYSVARLQRQHAEILDTLGRIADACQSGGALDQAAAGVREVISQLREHEAEEHRLMQDVVIDDIGTGD